MRYLSLIVLLWSLCFPSYAFFDKDVRLLTMQDGLADNSVSCIYKDKDGFMWFGTNNGLSRYDGKSVKNFSPSASYLPISDIVELSDECLGVIAGETLYCFDRKLETFSPVTYDSGEKRRNIFRILPVDNAFFWGISGDKLVLYQWERSFNKEGNQLLVRVKEQKEYSLLNGNGERYSAVCYSENRDGLCLVTDHGQLLLFYPDSDKPVRKVYVYNRKYLTANSILSKGGCIWISTTAEGIIRYHLDSGQIDRITYGGTEKENQLSHTDVFQVIPISNNRYLAATWSGYTLLMPDKVHPGKLITEIYNNTPSQVHRNLETRMISAYYDPSGMLWIGTNGGGVMYSDLRSQFYQTFYQDRHNEICDIKLGADQRLWLATFHRGVLRSNEPFSFEGKLTFSEVSRSHEMVLCVLKDERDNLWFGNGDGSLTYYNNESGQFTDYPLLVNGVANTSRVWSMHIDRKGRFWIGTGKGLLLFERKTKECRHVPVESRIKDSPKVFARAIAETKDGTLWLGTNDIGICKLQVSDAGAFTVKVGYEQKFGLANSEVRSLLASSDGNLYVGYTDGFAVLSVRTDGIREFYTTHDGLCSNFIGCITEDGKGRIWLGSNSGISRYSRHQHLFYNYYIAGSNRSALFSNEALFFGNNRSLTYFNPDEVEVYPENDRVAITGLEIDNRPANIGEEINNQTVLSKGISFVSSIVLNNANRDFSLTFNNLSYSEEQQKYNYRLLPYQEHWLVANDGEKASYTNLPEGEYMFEVKNIYPDGHGGELTSLKITILPHWSRTWPFRLLVFVLLVAAVAYLVRLIRKRQRRLEHEMQMKHELLTANLEREKERQVRVERENFFTGAAHELRTPLTLILSPLQEMLQQTKSTDPLYNRLSVMYKNGTSLHTLVDHLLYVQKIEAGMVKLRLSEADIVELIKEVSAAFNEMAESKGFHFEVQLPETPLLLWIDTEKIFSAVQNLLSNAFKYTSPGGLVSLSADRVMKDGKGYCRVVVSDTGAGINEDLRERIFDSFITGDNTPGFSTKVGIGLRIVKNTIDIHHGVVTLDSAPGEGSVFTLFIPEGREHFTGDTYEIVECRSTFTSDRDRIWIKAPALTGQQSEPETRKRLLIVEDNPDVREYIRSLFIQKYTVLEAKDGEEGVQMATENLPDLIISDVMMPVKDGFACCREIRARQETAHIPILMLTAKAEDADILQGSRSGADDYMMKPFNPEILKAKVENLILQRERLKRIYTKALMLKQEPDEGEVGDSFMQQVVNIVEANIADEAFSVKALADQLNMSQPTLYRKLKQHSELAAVDIIRSIRVSKAASLIMENRYSIQEISEMVGFNDVRTLRKHFTGQFGVSPSKYMEGK